jgi:malonyl-CoA O-methyltransferase
MQLPLADGCVDLVYSNLMLQWCDRPAAAFAEIKRVLRPGGLLMASTFGPATLQELRAAWSNADSVPHVSEFVDLPQLASAAMAGGLAEPVLDVETVLRHYRDVGELQQELRAIGARNARNDRRHSLMGKSRLKQMIAAYENVRESRGLPATYEVFFLSAFGAEGSRRESLSRTTAGEHVVPIHNLPTRKRP